MGLPIASVVACAVSFAAYTTINSVTIPHTHIFRAVFQTLWIRVMTRTRVRTKNGLGYNVKVSSQSQG